MKKIFDMTLLLLALALPVQAQTLTYPEYMQAVAEKNTSYLAEKHNVDIATANLQAAKVFNDPELSVDYTNNQDWYMLMGQSLEFALSYDLDISGNRRARIRAASSEKEITEASVAAFLCNLRFEAAQAWAEAWRLQKSVALTKEGVRDMELIARSDSLRLKAGDVGRADATQSHLEAQTMRGQLTQMEAEYRSSLMDLSLLMGGESVSALGTEDLPITGRTYDEQELFLLAENHREDLKAAELGQTLSENNLKMVKASRIPELGLSLGYSYNNEVRNEIAPAPKVNGLSVGISIPLKFSSLNKGGLNAAKAEVLQSQKIYETARLQVHTEVAQAYTRLQAARKVLTQYDGTMISDARQVLESRKAGYLKGESSLLDLLTAQRTYQDVMLSYVQAQCDCYVCEVSLQHAIGIGQ